MLQLPLAAEDFHDDCAVVPIAPVIRGHPKAVIVEVGRRLQPIVPGCL
jgi:hypothetical protein